MFESADKLFLLVSIIYSINQTNEACNTVLSCVHWTRVRFSPSPPIFINTYMNNLDNKGYDYGEQSIFDPFPRTTFRYILQTFAGATDFVMGVALVIAKEADKLPLEPQLVNQREFNATVLTLAGIGALAAMDGASNLYNRWKAGKTSQPEPIAEDLQKLG